MADPKVWGEQDQEMDPSQKTRARDRDQGLEEGAGIDWGLRHKHLGIKAQEGNML